MEAPSDLVSPPSDLVSPNQPPSDLVSPPSDLVPPKEAAKEDKPVAHFGSGDKDHPLPDTPMGKAIAQAQKEVVGVEDMILGVPGFFAKMGLRGALDVANAVRGEQQPMQTTEQQMAPADVGMGKAIQSPISSLTGVSPEGSKTQEVMGKVGGLFDRAAEYWTEKTGNPEIGKAVKRGEDIVLGKGVDVAMEGVSSVAKKIATQTQSVKEATEVADLAKYKKQADASKKAQEAPETVKPTEEASTHTEEELTPPSPSKVQEGKADPELLGMLGAGALGATAFTAMTSDGDTTLPGFIGKMAVGGGLGILLAKAPSAWRDYSTVPREQFMDDIARRHGSEMREAAGLLWDAKTPQGWEKSKYGKNATEKYVINRDILNKGYRVDGAAKASMISAIKARQELTNKGMTEDIAKGIYDLEDGKEVSPEVKDFHDKYYKPVVDDLGKILSDISGYTGKSVEELKTDFFPRMALDKRSTLQKLMEGDGVHLGGKPSSSFGRTLFAIDTPDMGPVIVHVDKDGHLSGFHRGQNLGMGTVKGKAILGEDLLGADGQNYGKLRQATKNEVEENSDTKYWNDAMTVALIKRAEAQANLDQIKFFDGIKNHPNFAQMFAEKIDKAPADWKPLTSYAQKKLPMFRDYAFNPRLKETLESMIGKEPSGSAMTLLEGINNIAMKNLLLNPLPHIDNEIVHYLTAKGLTNWIKGDPATSLQDAWNSVRSQDDIQLELMNQGMATLYTDRWVNNNVKTLAGKQMEAIQASKAFDGFAAKLGMAPLEFYKALSDKSGDLMWSTRDTLVTHLVQQKIADMIAKSGGKVSREEAVRTSVEQVMKDMPSYRLPPRVAEEFFTKLLGEKVGQGVSRGVSQLGSNQLLTSFFRYHYAVASELANMVKEVAVGTTQEKLHAMDKVAALVTQQLILDTVLSQAAQWVTGDDQAKMRAAGPLHLIEKMSDVAEGKHNAVTYLVLSVLAPPMWMPLAETLVNKTFPTGHNVMDESQDATTQIGQGIGHVVSRMLPQAGMFTQSQSPTGDVDWNQVLARQADIQIPTEKQKALKEKEDSMQIKTGLTREERAAERRRKKELSQ